MGFESVLASEVKLERPTIPAGDYVFELLPGCHERVNQFNGVSELNMTAAVAEGDQAGKRVFWNYPDPTAIAKKSGKAMDWSAQAMKKLQVVLGIDPNEGETFPDYFARVGAERPRFAATMAPGNYVPKDGGDPKVEFNIFSVRVAA